MERLVYSSNLYIFCFILENKFADNLLMVFELNDFNAWYIVDKFWCKLILILSDYVSSF